MSSPIPAWPNREVAAVDGHRLASVVPASARGDPEEPGDTTGPDAERPAPYPRAPLRGGFAQQLWQNTLLFRRQYPRGGASRDMSGAAGWLWREGAPARAELWSVPLMLALATVPLWLFCLVPLAPPDDAHRSLADLWPVALCWGVGVEGPSGSATGNAAVFLGTPPDSFLIRAGRTAAFFLVHLGYFSVVGYHKVMMVVHFSFWGAIGFAPAYWMIARRGVTRHDLVCLARLWVWLLSVALANIVVGLLFLVLFNVVSGGLQPVVSITYSFVIFVVKWIARKEPRMSTGYCGPAVSELWGDPYSIVTLMTTFGMIDSPLSFATVLAAQVVGTVGIVALHLPQVRPHFEALLLRARIRANPHANDRVCRAVARFMLSVVAHVFAAALMLIYLIAGFHGPNREYFPVGYWSDTERQRALIYVLVWAAAFPLLGLAMHPLVRRQWGIDSLRVLQRILCELASYAGGLLGALPACYMLLVLKHAGGVWTIFPENGTTA